MELSTMGKLFIWKVLLLFAAEFLQCDAYFSKKMASPCKEYISNAEYNYKTFYKVNAIDRKFGPGVKFEMHLSILAESNGHILLSSTENPKADDPVYEFVVGGGYNLFYQLRTKQSRDGKVDNFAKNILSLDAFRGFWIKVMTDGLVEFGIQGTPLATLKYKDPNPVDVQYFSFTTWPKVPGWFLYDCHFSQKDADAIVLESIQIDNQSQVDYQEYSGPEYSGQEPELTTRQELRENITRRGRGRPDEDTTTVYVTAAFDDLRFDSDNCFLEATLTLVMSWMDEAISWQPEMYNGTDNLSVRNNEIWSPELVLYNAVGHGVMEPSESQYLHVTSEGVATVSLRTRQQVSCAFSDDVQYRWPRDGYECNFLIGPWSMQDHLTLDMLTDGSVSKYIKAAATPALSTEWDIIYVNQSKVTSQPGNSPHYGVSNSTSDEAQSAFEIQVSIKRKSNSYYLFLTVTFTVIVALILLSFFLSPLSEYRVWFNCGMAVIICLFIIHMDTVVPSNTVPLILMCYTVTMFMLIAMLLIQVILQHRWCRRLFRSRPMQTAVELRPIKKLQTHERLDFGDDSVSIIGDVTSREIKPDNFAVKILMIDRIVIGIYTAVYVTMAVIVYL